MKYLKEQTFVGWKGQPIELKMDGQKPKPLNVSEVLVFMLDLYSPDQGKMLSGKERRQWNKVTELLEGDPSEVGGYFAIEDDDFAVLKKIVKWVADIIRAPTPQTPLPRHMPYVEDLLEPQGEGNPKGFLEKLPGEKKK